MYGILLQQLFLCYSSDVQSITGLSTSRVCAEAQYTVLQANAKVNGRGPFLHPNPSETPQPISMSCQVYYYVPPGVDVQNLVGIDSAVRDLRMREKHVLCGFFINKCKKLRSLNMVLEAKSHV